MEVGEGDIPCPVESTFDTYRIPQEDDGIL